MKMRNLLRQSLAAALCILLLDNPVPVQAESADHEFIIGEHVKAVLSEDGCLQITGTGMTYDYSIENPAPFLSEGKKITAVSISSDITGLGSYLFYNCSQLTGTLVLPAALQSIGSNALNGDSFEQAPKFTSLVNEFTGFLVQTDTDQQPSPSTSPTAEGTPAASFTPTADVTDSPLPTGSAKAESTSSPEVSATAESTAAGSLPPSAAAATEPTAAAPLPSAETALPSSSAGSSPENTAAAADRHWVTQQTIGSSLFHSGQSGTYQCSAENNSFIEAAAAAGYTDINAQPLADSSSGQSWNGKADTSWYDSTAGVFSLTTPNQLAGLSKLVNQGNSFAGKTIYLAADMAFNQAENASLMLSGKAWQAWSAIGSDEQHPFSGTFDGQNHTLTGLYCREEKTAAGLFGNAEGAVIRNLRIAHSLLMADNNSAAGAVVSASHSSADHITLIDDIISSSKGSVGGIIGTAYSTMISRCSIESSSTIWLAAKEGGYGGGIAGSLRESQVLSCANTGAIKAEGNPSVDDDIYKIGGIVGDCMGSKVINSYFAGTISLSFNCTFHSSIAGLVGGIEPCENTTALSTIANCCAGGKINYSNTTNKYAISGMVNGSVNFENNYLEAYYQHSYGWMYGTSIQVKNLGQILEQKIFYLDDSGPNDLFLDLIDLLNKWVDENSAVYPQLYTWVKGTAATDNFPYFGVRYDTSWYADDSLQGNGTQENPYVLLDMYDLIGFRMIVNDESPYVTTADQRCNYEQKIPCDHFAGKYVRLGNDITLNDSVLKSDGTLNQAGSIQHQAIADSESHAFKGTFDGDGHAISGLYCTTDANIGGLFGYNAGSIQNLSILDSYFNSTNINAAVGAAAAINLGTISKVNSASTVIGSTEQNNGFAIGGITGVNRGKISHCSNSGSVTGGFPVGGIAGNNSQGISNYPRDTDVEINFCCNSGIITSRSGIHLLFYNYAGGIVGRNWYSSKIINSWNTGSINADTYSGGIAANQVTQDLSMIPEIINCYNAGRVNGNHMIAGGIVAWGGESRGGIVQNCYNIGTIFSSYKGTILGSKGISDSYTYVLNNNPSAGHIGSFSTLDHSSNYGTFTDAAGRLAMENGTAADNSVTLTEALNAFVTDYKGSSLAWWKSDPAVNGGYPTLTETDPVPYSEQAITAGKEYLSDFSSQSTVIDDSGSMTAAWSVQFLGSPACRHVLRFAKDLPAKTKLICLRIAENSAVWYEKTLTENLAANTDLPLTEFHQINADSCFQEPVSGNVQEQFRVSVDLSNTASAGSDNAIQMIIYGRRSADLTYLSNNSKPSLTLQQDRGQITVSGSIPAAADDSINQSLTPTAVIQILNSAGQPVSFKLSTGQTELLSKNFMIVLPLQPGTSFRSVYKVEDIPDAASGTYLFRVQLYAAYDAVSVRSSLLLVQNMAGFSYTAKTYQKGFRVNPNNRMVSGNTAVMTYSASGISPAAMDVQAYAYNSRTGQYSSSPTAGFSAALNGSKLTLAIPEAAKISDCTAYRLVFTQAGISYTTYIIVQR